MAHLQYPPGDPRLVDQLVYELKSKGIFDQFRKECISDVDTRPAYQNLRQRVESSVSTFLSRQVWKPDLNKNQLREKLRKHILEGNYLEQGVERIVDQVVNPKVASVFIPQVEDLVYNYLGIPRKKATEPETSNGKADLLPTDLEAVSPGSVHSNNDDSMEIDVTDNIDIDDDKSKADIKEDSIIDLDKEKEESRLSGISELTIHDSDVSIDKNTTTIPLPKEEIKLENIPAPENSPPKINDKKIDLEKIDLPKEPNLSTDIPLPDEIPPQETEVYFKPINSEDDDSSSYSSVHRNVSPLTPIRNFNNENSCDAQQAFENNSDSKDNTKKEPSSFRFTIDAKSENNSDEGKVEKKEEPVFSMNMNFNTPLYDDSSNSNNLQIDYESDANSKLQETKEVKPETDQNSVDSQKKEKKDDKKSSKSSHKSRDSHRHSSSKDHKSESKHSNSRESSRHHDKKKDDKSKSSKDKPSEKSDKKDNKDSSKYRSSSSHKSSSKDSKHKSSSSSKHSSSSKDDRKSSSSSQKDKDKISSSRDKHRDSKSSRDKDKKSHTKKEEKDGKEKKEKKDVDDHYSVSGRGNHSRRSTDRDSNDGSSSSKGSHNPSSSKTSGSKKDGKSSSKSDNTSNSGDSNSPSDGVEVIQAKSAPQNQRIIHVDTRLETPISTPPRLPFVPDVTLKKPRFASNLREAKEMMKMRKFLEEEQKRMNQEATLLLEFQANVRPSLSQVYSSIPGPELEFACVSNLTQPTQSQVIVIEPANECNEKKSTEIELESKPKAETKTEVPDIKYDEIAQTLIALHGECNTVIQEPDDCDMNDSIQESKDSITDMLTDSKTEHDVVVPVVNAVEVLESHYEETSVNDVKPGDDVQCKEMINDKVEEILKTNKKSLETKKESLVPEKNTVDKEIEEICSKSGETALHYFAEHEKYDAEIEKGTFSHFLNNFNANLPLDKLYLINCDTYEENLMKEASKEFGHYEIVNYVKNGHLKLPAAVKNIIKDVNIATEVALPAQIDNYERPNTPNRSPIFSPGKSECSFELSSDYDAKLEEMVNKTSRQEIMEIILGGVMDESPSKMPRIDYCMESNIEECCNLKRKLDIEIETNDNNNRQVLTPNKLRKLSGSDQITSTTEETEETNNSKSINPPRSKYLGKAKRIGLSRPKKTNLPNSPSSDKSVENYEHNLTPNGKIKAPRNKDQRYEKSDLYKPKLHYLSRRNNIT